MLKRLENRSLGLTTPKKFLSEEASRMSSTFEQWKVNRFPKNHRGSIMTLDVDRIHGQFLLAGSADGLLRIHNIRHPNLENSSKFATQRLTHRYCSMKFVHIGVQCVQWYPNGIELLTSSGIDGAIKMWDVNGLRILQTFYPCTTHKARIFQHHQSVVATTPLVAAASSDGMIPLVDLRYGSTAHRLRAHNGFVLVCKWSTTDENLLTSAGADGTIRLWDIRHTQKPMYYFDVNFNPTLKKRFTTQRASHGNVINCMEFTIDGCRLISFGTDDMIRVWDVYTGKPCPFNSGKIVNNNVKHLEMAVSSNARPQRMFVPTERFIHTIDVESGDIINTLKAHNADVIGMAYNPHFEELYSAGKDREIMVWKPHTEQMEAIAERAQQIRHCTARIGFAGADLSE